MTKFILTLLTMVLEAVAVTLVFGWVVLALLIVGWALHYGAAQPGNDETEVHDG